MFGDEERVDGVDPGFARVFRFHWTSGSNALLGRLAPDGAIVEKSFAKTHHLRLGSPFRITTSAGRPLALRVAGLQSPRAIEKLDPLIAKVVIAQSTFDKAFPSPKNAFTFVNTRAGATPPATAALERSTAAFPDAKLETRPDWVSSRSKGIDQLLNLLYVLLALSVIVSLFGMVNTLVLSVFERTREVGMLRAVGMTRRQVRRMVRHESVITALIGAGLGLPIGVAVAALVSKALEDEGVAFSLPVGSLIAFTIVAIFAGIVAAILPARRASRLDVLEALAYE
jgi:ABC-type antimicrobial peptide transport system permease subunit